MRKMILRSNDLINDAIIITYEMDFMFIRKLLNELDKLNELYYCILISKSCK